MVLIEKGFKWGLLTVLVLMVIGAAGSAGFGMLLGLMSDPVAIIVVLAGFGALLLALVVPALAAGLWLWRWAKLSAIAIRRADQFVAPDEAGRLPVPASLLKQPEFANRAIDSHVASYMSNVTSYHYQPNSTQTITGADGQTLGAAAAGAPDTFWQLYQAGQLPSKGFLMGYSLDEDGEGEEVTADWKHLYSCLIGGKSGTGKSTLIRSILAQSALQGGRFVVIDPHYSAGEESLGASLQPLRSLMLCDVASNKQQMIDALNYVYAIGQRRLAGQDADRWPLILVVDETTALFKRSNVANELTRVLGSISEETRKVGVYALCIGQNFDGRIMDTTVRNSFVSMISMRARRDVARVQSGSTEFGQMAEGLQIGQCVWMAPSGETYRLAVPNCTAADLELVARNFDGKNVYTAPPMALPLEAPSSAPSSTPSSGASSEPLAEPYLERHFPKAGTGSGTGKPTAAELGAELANDERTRRAIDLFLAGSSQNAILKELWGDPTGRAKVKASNEFNEILRSHLMRVKEGTYAR